MKKTIAKMSKCKINIPIILCVFIIIQPFLDYLPFFENDKYQIFGFAIPTLIRFGFVAILSALFIRKVNKSKIKYLIIYFALLLIYFIIHNQVAGYNSKMIIPSNYTYSLVGEIFYLLRMLLPLLLVYVISKIDIRYKKMNKTLLISSAIIGTIIFIGNTLCISYVSYGNGFTKVNWVHWFTSNINEYSFEELTSKGWFYMANQVSGIMILLLPFNIYELIMNKTKLSIYSTTILIISMIMIGTRTASYGWVAIIIAIIMIFIILKKVLKSKELQDKKIMPLIIITVIGTIFLINSPIINRTYGYELGNIEKNKERPNIKTSKNIEDVYEYIEENYKNYGINKIYLQEIYNYKNDPIFWYNIFDYSEENGVIENREMEVKITKRIVENNKNDIKYKLFGYSFTRMRNAKLYIEHDFIIQYYTMGLVGTILLISPYLGIIGLMFYKIIKNIKSKIVFHDIIFMLSISMTLLVSLITGHILDELFVTIYISFICGFFFRKLNKKILNKEVKHEEN